MGRGGLASEYKYASTDDVTDPECHQAHGGYLKHKQAFFKHDTEILPDKN
jgi:hypothetical protein